MTERAEYRYWDHWLTDGREPHVFAADVATGRAATCSPAPGSRCRRGIRRPSDSTSRPTAARSRSPSTSAPSRGMMNSARHRRWSTLATRAQAHADRGQRNVRRASALFAGRPHARVHVVQHEARVQRPGPSDASVERSGGRACAARAALRPRDRRTCDWAPDSAALLFTGRGPRPAGPVPPGARRRDAADEIAPAARSAASRSLARRQAHRLRPREPVASAGVVRDRRRRQRRAADRVARIARCSTRHAFGEAREFTSRAGAASRCRCG